MAAPAIVDFFQAIAEGQFGPDYMTYPVVGRNILGVVPSIWTFLGTGQTGVTPWMPQAATPVSVASTDVNDKTGGTGATTVRVWGLDDSFLEANETVSMNGTTPVNTTQKFRRVFGAMVMAVGTYGGANLGNISVQSGTNVAAMILAKEGRSSNMHTCVPQGLAFYFHSLNLQVHANSGGVDIQTRLWSRPNANTVSAPFGPARVEATSYSQVMVVPLDYSHAPIKFAEYTDIWGDAIIASGSGKASVIASAYFIRKRN